MGSLSDRLPCKVGYGLLADTLTMFWGDFNWGLESRTQSGTSSCCGVLAPPLLLTLGTPVTFTMMCRSKP